jgi:hypothetical protein
MANNLLKSLKDLQGQPRQKYDEVIFRLQQELERVIALRDIYYPPGKLLLGRRTGARFAIHDIKEFLRERDEPCLQADIVRVVGTRRKARYPELQRPFANVWKSLESHHRRKSEVVCVEYVGRQRDRLRIATLKPKPPQERTKGGQEDRAELYESPRNLFYLKSEIKTYRRKPNYTASEAKGTETEQSLVV